MMIEYDIAHQTDGLKKLIAEHPDYPIAVLVSEEVNDGGWSHWMYAQSISFSVGEILDCDAPYNSEIVESDRDNFNEQLEEWLWEELTAGRILSPAEAKGFEPEFQKLLAEEKAKYEPYWTKAICVWAGV